MCAIIYATIILTESNEVANVIIVCDYYMFGWKSKMKVHIFHPILWMNPWMDEKLIVFAIKANIFSIYNILMIETYVISLDLQYLFDNQLVSNYLLVFCIVYWHCTNLYIFIKYIWGYDLFIKLYMMII
jgi:hypothetical protein